MNIDGDPEKKGASVGERKHIREKKKMLKNLQHHSRFPLYLRTSLHFYHPERKKMSRFLLDTHTMMLEPHSS